MPTRTEPRRLRGLLAGARRRPLAWRRQTGPVPTPRALPPGPEERETALAIAAGSFSFCADFGALERDVRDWGGTLRGSDEATAPMPSRSAITSTALHSRETISSRLVREKVDGMCLPAKHPQIEEQLYPDLTMAYLLSVSSGKSKIYNWD